MNGKKWRLSSLIWHNDGSFVKHLHVSGLFCTFLCSSAFVLHFCILNLCSSALFCALLHLCSSTLFCALLHLLYFSVLLLFCICALLHYSVLFCSFLCSSAFVVLFCTFLGSPVLCMFLCSSALIFIQHFSVLCYFFTLYCTFQCSSIESSDSVCYFTRALFKNQNLFFPRYSSTCM